MPTLDLVMIGAGLASATLFVLAWRRFPRHRKRLVLGAAALAALAAFGGWWVLFRVDDPTFARDRDDAHRAQQALDDALGKDF